MRRLTALTCALAVSAGAAGCSKSGSSGSSDTSSTLTISIPISPNSLNPLLAQSTMEQFIDELMFPHLIVLGTSKTEVPSLADPVPSLQNGGISADQKTLTYHLRPNAKWSDGTPITAADVIYSAQQMNNTANNVASHEGFDEIASMSAPDAHTVVVKLKRIFPPFLDDFFGPSDNPVEIVPKHILAQYPNLNQIPFDAEPNVTGGAFKFGEWVRGDHLTFVANNDYFGGAPKIARLIVKPIADTNTVNAQLRTGEVQLALELTGPQYHQLQGVQNVAVTAVEAPSYDSVLLNTQHPIVNDVHVRQALAYAVDRNALVKNLEFGNATPGVGDLSPFSWAFDPSLKAQPYDPAQARRLLDADGWLVGPGGIRTKNGQRLSLVAVYGQGSDVARNFVVELQQYWRAIGVDLAPKSFPYADLYAAAQDGGIFNAGKFDVGFYAWQSGADPDDSQQTLSTAIPPNGNNAGRYQSAAMDALQNQALSTFDRSTRKTAYAKIQALLVNDVPSIYLFYPRHSYAFTPQLHGFAPTGVSEAWNAQDWSLTP